MTRLAFGAKCNFGRAPEVFRSSPARRSSPRSEARAAAPMPVAERPKNRRRVCSRWKEVIFGQDEQEIQDFKTKRPEHSDVVVIRRPRWQFSDLAIHLDLRLAEVQYQSDILAGRLEVVDELG